MVSVQSGLVVCVGTRVGRALSSMVLNWEDIIYEFGSAPKFSGVCCACSMSLHTSHIHRLLNAIFDWHAQHSTRCRKKSTNILYPCDGIWGRHVRQCVQTMEQALCVLHVEWLTPTWTHRPGIQCSFRIRIAKCEPLGAPSGSSRVLWVYFFTRFAETSHMKHPRCI